eukprot:gene27200-biopygen7304
MAGPFLRAPRQLRSSFAKMMHLNSQLDRSCLGALWQASEMVPERGSVAERSDGSVFSADSSSLARPLRMEAIWSL